MPSWLQSLSRLFSGPKPTGEIAPRDIVKSWIQRLNVDLVIDVGANEGHFVERMRADDYAGPIISFEPLREAFEKLSTRYGQSPGWRGFQLALGERNAELRMDVSGNGMMSSSLLTMLPSHVEALPDSAIRKTEMVQVRRLDKAVEGELHGAQRIFLKIDTQGFEDQVLGGASGIMDRVVLLEVEMSLVPLYAGQRLMPEMMSSITGMGYVPVDISRGFADNRRGRLLQVDGLFVRSASVNTLPFGFQEDVSHAEG